MSKMSSLEIYEKAVEKSKAMCCLNFQIEGSLKYADDEVLVCEVCQQSIDVIDLQTEWQNKIEIEVGLYD